MGTKTSHSVRDKAPFCRFFFQGTFSFLWRYCELAIDEQKQGSHSIENQSFHDIYLIMCVCVLWCARLWSSRLAQRNLSLPGPPDSNVHRPHALGAFGTLHCGVGRWGWYGRADTRRAAKRTIDMVLLYKMAAGKRQFELCSWGGVNSTKWLCSFKTISIRAWMRLFDHCWMKNIEMVVDSRDPRQLTGTTIL